MLGIRIVLVINIVLILLKKPELQLLFQNWKTDENANPWMGVNVVSGPRSFKERC